METGEAISPLAAKGRLSGYTDNILSRVKVGVRDVPLPRPKVTHAGIDLFLREETIKAGTRLNKHFELSWVGESKTSKAGHEEDISKILKDLEIFDIDNEIISSETTLKKNFIVNTDKGGFDYDWGYRMYTDGSKNKNGVGAGLCYMRDDEVLVRENIGLPAKANIFQAELKPSS